MPIGLDTRVDEILIELTRPGGREDPYPLYRELRERSPLARAQDGALVLTRYEDCHALLRSADVGHGLAAAALFPVEDHPCLAQATSRMLFADPPRHSRLRRLVSSAFTARRVAALRPAVEACTAELVDRLPARGNFVDAFAFPLPIGVIGGLLGVPPDDHARFQTLVRDATMILDQFTPEILARADAATIEIRDYLGGLADQRRLFPRDDLLTAMLDAADSDGRGLDADELLSMATLLFEAGFETTTHLLGNSLVALLARPEQRRSLQEPDQVPGAVEELLRFDSPVQLVGRTVLRSTVVAGVPLSPGERVIAYLGAGNHDPARFRDPDVLDLTRTGVAALSFGGGVHFCLGAPLARLEARVALPALFARHPDLHLDGLPVRRDSLTLRGYLELPVAFR